MFFGQTTPFKAFFSKQILKGGGGGGGGGGGNPHVHPISFVAPFWVKFYFGPNTGMWGVQSVAMELLPHTALFQSIWNHPAEENSQKIN